MKTPYKLMYEKKPTLRYFHVFEAKCFVLKDDEERHYKFDAKVHEGIFVGYSQRAYRVYIIGQYQVKESVNVNFDDTKLPGMQTKEPSESLKFDDYSNSDDDEEEPEATT